MVGPGLALGVWLVAEAVAPELHELRLVGAHPCLPHCHEGLLEIYDGGQWWALCDDRWDDADAEVACRQMDMQGGKAYQGLGSPEAMMAHSYTCGETCADAAWNAELHCDGSEARLSECSRVSATTATCGRSERAGLKCTTGPSAFLIAALVVNAGAVVAAVFISCRLAITRARELKRLDSVNCADIARSWFFVVRTAPRACLCGCCAGKPSGSGYGRPRRKKTAVRQEATTGSGANADHLGSHQPGDMESPDVVSQRGSVAPSVDADASAAIGAPQPIAAPLLSPVPTAHRPGVPEAKGLRRPLSAGGAERRAAVAQRWMQEGLVVTGPEPKRPSELIAEARGEDAETGSTRNRRKSNVTETWLAQSESAVVPVHADATLPLDPLEPAVDAPASELDDDYREFVTGSRSEVRLGEEASPILGGAGGLTSIT
eukprot:COSAG02_NODE_827_length_16704_cov_8.649322_12_plen_432_part_00